MTLETEMRIAWLMSNSDVARCAITGKVIKGDGVIYRGQIICQEQYDKIREFEGRLEDRADRFESRAQRLMSEGERIAQAGRDMFSRIPYGEPIHIGHYSEQRDRNYRKRADNKIRKGIETQSKGEYYAERAKSARANRAIKTEDPAALIKLREKLEQCESMQEKMRERNKIIRKVIKQFPDDLAAQQNFLAENHPEIKLKLLEPDFVGRIGYPDYALSNNSAEIRRLKKRIQAMERLQEKIVNDEAVSDEMRGDVRIERDEEANRIRLHFPGKPSEKIRKLLKSRGWRWSPANSAWQAYPSAEYSIDTILKAYEESNG